eukprot:c25422_g1_i1 orf=418-1134(+)
MAWREGDMDRILVPAGVFLLLAYHSRLVYRVLKFPTTTIIGLNQINRRAWVYHMMKDGMRNGVLAVQTLRNNIMAGTLLATAAITLSSLIAVIISSSTTAYSPETLIFGERGSLTSSIKLLCILMCFLFAFLCNVQSVRYFSHASFLISIPMGDDAPELTREYVARAVLRGSQFWSIGLRVFYFSLPLILWIFGPIPMFSSSLVLLMVLHFLDTAENSEQNGKTRIESCAMEPLQSQV